MLDITRVKVKTVFLSKRDATDLKIYKYILKYWLITAFLYVNSHVFFIQKLKNSRKLNKNQVLFLNIIQVKIIRKEKYIVTTINFII